MYRAAMIAVGFGLLCGSPPANALPRSSAEALDKIGPWHVSYQDDYCDLLAEFGKGDRNVILDFRRFDPGDYFDLTLYGRRFDGVGADNDSEVDFGVGPTTRTNAIGGIFDKLPMVYFGTFRFDGVRGDRMLTDPVPPEIEGAVSGVTIAVPGLHRFRLNFGSLVKPLAALRACQIDLLKHWGFDPDVQTHLSRAAQPKNSPQYWLNPEDYPNDLNPRGINGMVQFRLDIDEEGQVAACHILLRTNSDAFADTTCKAISSRAKFDPALDANGKPVRSFYVRKVLWRSGY